MAALGETRSWEPTNELHARYWTTEYPVDAIVTLMSLVDLVTNSDLSTMTTPTLVMYSEADQVIDVDMIKRRFAELGADLLVFSAHKVYGPMGLGFLVFF